MFPALAAAGSPTTGAANVAQAINHVANLGLGYQPQAATDVRSASLDLTGATPAFQTSTNSNAFTPDIAQLNAKRKTDAKRLGKTHDTHAQPTVGGIEDWWNSAKNDAESMYHGLRHGAIEFKQLATTWADDTKSGTVNLIVDIGDGLDTLITYVVTDIKSAIHARSGWLRWLLRVWCCTTVARRLLRITGRRLSSSECLFHSAFEQLCRSPWAGWRLPPDPSISRCSAGRLRPSSGLRRSPPTG